MIAAAPPVPVCDLPTRLVCVANAYRDALREDGFFLVRDRGALRRKHALALARLGAEIITDEPDFIPAPEPAPGMTRLCVDSHCILAWTICTDTACSYSFGWPGQRDRIIANHFRIVATSPTAFRRAAANVFVPLGGPSRGPFMSALQLTMDAANATSCADSMQSLEPPCLPAKGE